MLTKEFHKGDGLPLPSSSLSYGCWVLVLFLGLSQTFDTFIKPFVKYHFIIVLFIFLSIKSISIHIILVFLLAIIEK